MEFSDIDSSQEINEETEIDEETETEIDEETEQVRQNIILILEDSRQLLLDLEVYNYVTSGEMRIQPYTDILTLLHLLGILGVDMDNIDLFWDLNHEFIANNFFDNNGSIERYFLELMWNLGIFEIRQLREFIQRSISNNFFSSGADNKSKCELFSSLALNLRLDYGGLIHLFEDENIRMFVNHELGGDYGGLIHLFEDENIGMFVNHELGGDYRRLLYIIASNNILRFQDLLEFIKNRQEGNLGLDSAGKKSSETEMGNLDQTSIHAQNILHEILNKGICIPYSTECFIELINLFGIQTQKEALILCDKNVSRFINILFMNNNYSFIGLSYFIYTYKINIFDLRDFVSIRSVMYFIENNLSINFINGYNFLINMHLQFLGLSFYDLRLFFKNYTIQKFINTRLRGDYNELLFLAFENEIYYLVNLEKFIIQQSLQQQNLQLE